MLKTNKCILLALGILSQAQVGFSQRVYVNKSWVDGDIDTGTYYVCRVEDEGAASPYYDVTKGAAQVFRALVPTGHDITQWSYGTTDGQTELNQGHFSTIVESTSDTISITATSASTLYLACHFDWLKYSISFSANGGTGTMAPMQNLVYTNAVALSANAFTRTGFSFAGWQFGDQKFADKAKVKGQTFGLDYMKKAVSLSAMWTTNSYTVTFDPGAGSVSTASKKVAYLSAYGELPEPERTGYAFSGWFTDAEGGTKVTSDTKLTTAGNLTLHAHWQASGYTLTLIPGYDGGKTNTLNVTYQSAYGNLPTISRTGYRFDGWFTDSEKGDQVTVETIVTTAADHKLFAHWTANTIVVTLNPAGGELAEDTLDVTYDSPYGDLPRPERKGYTFTGWFTASSGGTQIADATIVKDPAAHVLYARWKATEYTLTFDANGGTVTPSKRAVAFDTTFGTLPVPVRTGYKFTGWFVAGTVGEQVYASTKLVEPADMTLCAHWEASVYRVTFNANGGSASKSVQDITYAATYGVLAAAERSGYVFAGWFTALDGGTRVTDDTRVTATSDHVLYAHWTADHYTVTFDANGGTLATPSQTVTYASPYGELPVPTRKGYAFAGWYTYATGGEKILSDTTVTTAKAHTLYAHWTANEYTLTFDANGGTVTPAKRTVAFDATFGTLPVPKRTGYKFDGWYSDKVSGEPIYASSKLSDAANQTVYARWEAISLDVQLSKDITGDGSGSVSGAGSYSYGTSVTIQAQPNEGSSFVRWSDGDTSSSRTFTITNAVNLSARFELNTYTVTFKYYDASGTEVSALQQVKYGKAAEAPARAVVDAYPRHKFTKWDDTTFGTVKGNLTVTAEYAEREYYTVVFRGNGATSGTMANQEIEREVSTTLETNLFQRVGYAFTGWANSADEAPIYADGAPVKNLAAKDATKILYAAWSTNTYTVAFFPNGGAGEMPYQNFAYDQIQALTANAFTCEGATFAGWVTDPDSTAVRTQYEDGQSVSNLSAVAGANVRLYATWKKTATNPSDLEVAADCYEDRSDRVALSLTTNDIGWCVATYGIDVQGEVPTGENDKCVKVAFYTDVNGGNRDLCATVTGSGTFSFRYKYTKEYGDFDGNKFQFILGDSNIVEHVEQTDGWVDFGVAGTYRKTTEGVGTFIWRMFKSADAYFAEDALYIDSIRWNPDVRASSSIGLTYRLNDGTAAPEDIYTNVTRKAGEAIGSWPVPPVPAGLKFEGWATSPESSEIVAPDWVIPSTDTQLYAVWSGEREPEPPTSGYLIFYARGASDVTGSMTNTPCELGKVYRLSPCGFSRTGYRFVGWDWDGKLYADGVLVFNLAAEDGVVLTFKAVWEAVP